MHAAIIIGTVRSLWTWLWGRYHVPQNVFLVLTIIGLPKIVFKKLVIHSLSPTDSLYIQLQNDVVYNQHKTYLKRIGPWHS